MIEEKAMTEVKKELDLVQDHTSDSAVKQKKSLKMKPNYTSTTAQTDTALDQTCQSMDLSMTKQGSSLQV